jgi:HD-GYP domain-containing protein (c-di-GMP phosphodiesterase class II)
MAGLFHDLGEAAIPEEILAKPDAKRTPAERELFYTHPEKTMTALKLKRMIIPATVEKAILQHHEAWHGRGFPKGLPAARLSEESQILSFADQFDELTRIEEGRERILPLKAWEEIKRTGSINPELLNRIRKVLMDEAPPQKAKAG